jgi:hypothetical protein|tara:strand:- start:746 stop:880 length:135 start_codon:yes stop_codon:yes gene_type:complete
MPKTKTKTKKRKLPKSVKRAVSAVEYASGYKSLSYAKKKTKKKK